VHNPPRIGLVGAGFISSVYLKAAKKFRQAKIVACADVQEANAKLRASEFKIGFQSVDGLIQDESLDLILNLTTPQSHVAISRRALEAGKHVYSEKPLGLSVEETEPLLSLARQKNLRVGCAPDTFLGGGQQTARKLIDDGAIGEPIGGTAFVMLPGHERWHPNPDFYYQRGGGPVYDMGPYYITALVNLLGPVKQVISIGKQSFTRRLIGSGQRKGESFPVEILTHFTALLEFAQNVIVSFHASFDVQGHSHSAIEIYGTEGTLQVPDPNTFGGPVRLLKSGNTWLDVPVTHGYSDGNYRMLGVAEMATAIRANQPHRASDSLAFHVLEVMEALVEGAATRKPISLRSSCERPRPLQPLSGVGSLL
jgi:predicted dehydrogenase